MELAKRSLLIGLVQKEQKRNVSEGTRTNVADLKLEAVATRETQKKVSLCCRRCCTSLRGIHISSWGSVTMYLSVFVVFCILQTLKIRKKALL